MVRGAREAVAKGRQIVIFPEGTRQELDAPPDYKPGIAAMYKDLDIAGDADGAEHRPDLETQGHHAQPGNRDVQSAAANSGRACRAKNSCAGLEDAIESEGQALLPPDRRRTVAA